MPETTVLRRGALTVVDYRCPLHANSPPFPEQHGCPSVSYVRKGSFGYSCRGQAFELVAGSVLVGHTGDEFTCTHEHVGGGDECLSFQLTPELTEGLGDALSTWRTGALPPLPELMVLGELAQASAEAQSDIGLDEAGLCFVARFIELTSRRQRGVLDARAALRRRVVEAALWVDEHSAEDLDLESTAAQAGLSPFHFLRLFSRVLGVTPHQYLVRCRLRRAARLLSERTLSVTRVALEVGFADLSNFSRTFQRAAGLSPRQFQKLATRRRAAPPELSLHLLD